MRRLPPIAGSIYTPPMMMAATARTSLKHLNSGIFSRNLNILQNILLSVWNTVAFSYKLVQTILSGNLNFVYFVLYRFAKCVRHSKSLLNKLWNMFARKQLQFKEVDRMSQTSSYPVGEETKNKRFSFAVCIKFEWDCGFQIWMGMVLEVIYVISM